MQSRNVPTEKKFRRLVIKTSDMQSLKTGEAEPAVIIEIKIN